MLVCGCSTEASLESPPLPLAWTELPLLYRRYNGGMILGRIKREDGRYTGHEGLLYLCANQPVQRGGWSVVVQLSDR